MMAAEIEYHGTMLAEFMQHGNKVTKRSQKLHDEAFDRLADAVADMQAAYYSLKDTCEQHNVAWEMLCGLSPVVAAFDDQHRDLLTVGSDKELLELLGTRGPGGRKK